MIEIVYVLRDDDGEHQELERRSEHVPRVGEFVSVDSYNSFQIVDVLWHLSSRDTSQRVTVTAYAADWHKHITEADAAWRAAAR